MFSKQTLISGCLPFTRNTRAREAIPGQRCLTGNLSEFLPDRDARSLAAVASRRMAAAGLQVMPRLDHGPRDRDEAVLAEMRAVLDKMAAIQMVDVLYTSILLGSVEIAH